MGAASAPSNLWRRLAVNNGLVVAALFGCRLAMAAEDETIRVEARANSGVHRVGQGFEVILAVTGADQRPELETPAIQGADAWISRNNELRPIRVTGIGGVMRGSNVFVGRLRVVPRRAGTLRIPSIRARVGPVTGRCQPIEVEVRPLPSEGRPSEFLGGVGSFTLKAETDSRSVRVGQELRFRIRVEGPAAWGMTGRPDLKRFDRPELGLRVTPGPVELVREPPARTFSYTLRPTRAGELVLPTVAVAAYDPTSGHYLTRVTPAVPVRVVDVPSFDPTTIPDLSRSVEAEGRTPSRYAAVAVGLILLLAAAIGILWVRRRARIAGGLAGPAEARRLARRLARKLARPEARDGPAVAMEIVEGLVEYLRVAEGRPPGAITPEEARAGVERARSLPALGDEAARIVRRCEGMLYRDEPDPHKDSNRLREEGRSFFVRLGRRGLGPLA